MTLLPNGKLRSDVRLKSRFPNLLWSPLSPVQPEGRRNVMPGTNTPIQTFLFMYNPKLKESRDRMKRVTANKEKEQTTTGCCGKVWNGIDALIECDGCSAWHHFKCEGLPLSAKKSQFYCMRCVGSQPVKRRPPGKEQPAKRLRITPTTPPAQQTGTTRNRTRTVKAPVKTNL